MKRSQRLDPIQRYRREREDQAAARLREANQRCDQLAAQIEQLRAFRQEYAGQINQVGSTGLSVHRLRLIQDFVARLDELIAEQEDKLAQLHQAREAARAAWEAEYRNRRALDTLVDRYQAEERREEQRAEQKALDERAARRR